MLSDRSDVVVVGGGPAGATAAALLARAGLDVTCVERERFPRFHVGESLLPANVPLFARLGVLSRLEEAGFLRKNGAVFFDEAAGRQVVLNFRAGPQWSDHAYNVPRAEFDRILLDHAIKEGARVVEGAEVRGVRLDPDGVRLDVALEDQGSRSVEAGFLVDATGRDALTATRLGRREPMPGLGKAAFFAHYTGAERWTGRMEGHIRVHLFDHGWFWWIPFAGDVTSIGCVLHQRAVCGRRATVEVLFDEMVAACPEVARGLAGAKRVGGVWSAANFSYRTAPAVGDRFVAVGDAVTFIDPVFSTGVYVAMQSAELAAAVVTERFRRRDFRAAAFQDYGQRIARGTALFFEFIERYYDPAFLDIFFATHPRPTLKDAVTTVFAGGAFLERPLWLRLRLAVVRLGIRYARGQRRRAGQSIESRLRW